MLTETHECDCVLACLLAAIRIAGLERFTTPLIH
jgi:hypothetical protein